MKIITGFQTGVDIAAARAARSEGLPTTGAMPLGFLTLAGPRPDYAALYGAYELPSANWNVRTRRNVTDADATFLFVVDARSRGTECALKAARDAGKSIHIVRLDFAEGADRPLMTVCGASVSVGDIACQMRRYEVVNVGGNRDAWLEERMEPVFREVFREWGRWGRLGRK